jgi:hypothetical protein
MARISRVKTKSKRIASARRFRASRPADPTLVAATDRLLLQVTRSVLGEYPKDSDNYPNTRGVLNTFKYTIRAQRV